MAGEGEVKVDNPWAEFGLNADGTPLKEEPKKVEPPKLEDVVRENAELKTTVAALAAKIEKIPDTFKGMNEKMTLIDKVIKAVAGEGDGEADREKYKAVFQDFKRIAPPGVAKLLEIVERDPDYLDKLTGATGALFQGQMGAINTAAHERIVELAEKAGFKGGTPEELNAMVFPFERTVTQMIEADPQLFKKFASGQLDVVDELFKNLIKPFAAQRLREKDARMRRNAPTPPPRSGASPNETKDGTPPKKPDIRTPQGKAAFHKEAVGRWLDQRQAASEEE